MADLKSPVADCAEHNAFFPSEYSLSQYVAKKRISTVLNSTNLTQVANTKF